MIKIEGGGFGHVKMEVVVISGRRLSPVVAPLVILAARTPHRRALA